MLIITSDISSKSNILRNNHRQPECTENMTFENFFNVHFVGLSSFPRPFMYTSVFQSFCRSGTPRKCEDHSRNPYALIREPRDVHEVEATGCLQTHFPSRAEPQWGRQSKQRWPIINTKFHRISRYQYVIVFNQTQRARRSSTVR